VSGHFLENFRSDWQSKISKVVELLPLLESREENRIADADRGDGKRFVVRADEKLIAFVQLESAISAHAK